MNDIPVIRYGHFNSRYFTKLGALYQLTKIPQLGYDRLLANTLETISHNFNDVILQNNKYTKQNIVYYELPLIVDDVRFTMDIAVLVTSSIAKFDRNRPRVVADAYVDYMEKGIIKFKEPVICIETITTALRTNVDDIKTYSGYNILKHITLDEVVINKTDFIRLTCDVRKERSSYTCNARAQVEGLLA